MNGSGTSTSATSTTASIFPACRTVLPACWATYWPRLSWLRISFRSQSNSGRPAGTEAETPAPANTNKPSAVPVIPPPGPPLNNAFTSHTTSVAATGRPSDPLPTTRSGYQRQTVSINPAWQGDRISDVVTAATNWLCSPALAVLSRVLGGPEIRSVPGDLPAVTRWSEQVLDTRGG